MTPWFCDLLFQEEKQAANYGTFSARPDQPVTAQQKSHKQKGLSHSNMTSIQNRRDFLEQEERMTEGHLHEYVSLIGITVAVAVNCLHAEYLTTIILLLINNNKHHELISHVVCVGTF